MGQGSSKVITTRDVEISRGGAVETPQTGGQESPDRAAEIEQTRAEMSETIEAIQQRLAPERITDEAKDVTEQIKDATLDAVDHAVHEAKTAAQEWGELAQVAALEAVDHAVQEAKAAFPEMSEHAKDAAVKTIDHALGEIQASLPAISEQMKGVAQEAVDHAIEEAKVAIRELGTQARVAVREATVGRVERMAHATEQTSKSFSSSVVTTIKQNPGPAALAGLGLSWLVMNGRSASSQSQPSTTGGAQSTPGVGDQVQEKAGQLAGQVQETAGQVADQVQETAGQVQHLAGDAADQVQASAGKVADQTQQTLGQIAGQVQQVPGRFHQILDQSPLAVGIVAAALGGAVALAIPETQRENQLMGDAKETLVERAQSGAQEVVEKVQRVTEEVGEAASKEARYQGLSPES